MTQRRVRESGLVVGSGSWRSDAGQEDCSRWYGSRGNHVSVDLADRLPVPQGLNPTDLAIVSSSDVTLNDRSHVREFAG